MSSSPGNFDRLLALLSLKRYEQPPPRYFAEFSGVVLARLERGDGRERFSWWRRCVGQWEESPVLACSLGVGACSLLLLGLSYFLWADPPTLNENLGASRGGFQAGAPSLTSFTASPNYQGNASHVGLTTTNPIHNPELLAVR